VQDKIVKSVLELCGTPKGKGVCQGVGIAGFVPASTESLEPVVKKYDR
jgi:hypothetical protein